MKITKIRPQQKELKVIVDVDTGDKIVLHKFGKELICTNVPEGLNKQSNTYITLKKACLISDYFNSDLHLKNRQIRHVKELQQRLKIFIGKNI